MNKSFDADNNQLHDLFPLYYTYHGRLSVFEIVKESGFVRFESFGSSDPTALMSDLSEPAIMMFGV